MSEGKSTSTPETDAEYKPMVISENMEEELHRLGASSDMIAHLKEEDEMVHLPMPGNLDGSIRTKALRCMFSMLQANPVGKSTWFQAALLLDRITACQSFCLEQLPLTCTCVTSLVLKCASSAAMPLAGEDVINDFATWLDSTQNCVTAEVSNRAVSQHEKEVLEALDFRVQAPCVLQWCKPYFTRLGLLASREFQLPVQQMHGTVVMFAHAVVMCVPASPMLSHGNLAAGLFSLSFVYSGLLPMASLMPSSMSAAEWSTLLAATPPVPPCRLPQAVTMRLMDMMCLTVMEKPDVIRAWSRHALEALSESLQQICISQGKHRQNCVFRS